MFVEVFSNNGNKYLRLVEGYYTKDKNGNPTCRKKVIKSIGRLDKYDDGKPDFVKRLKESFVNGNPLIEELKQYCVDTNPNKAYKIQITKGSDECIGHPKLYSQCLIERILEELGLISFIARYKQFTNYKFDLTGFFRLLVYGRILNPQSKIATVSQNNNYHIPVLDNPYEYNVYDTLDFIDDYSNQIINRINSKLCDNFGRTTNVVYYDVTNFFFEIEKPDDDTDEVKGLRKMGVSKEERKLPIVQMGLFMDEQGIPISIETFPGNTLDHLTMIDALENTVDKLHLPRFIFVGDRGMYRGNNTAHLINKNNGYIISKSIEKTNKNEKAWIYDENGYTVESENFKYKSRIIDRYVKVGDEQQKITEKVVVYWSKKFYDKQTAENRSFLEFIDKLQANPDNFRITKSQSKNLKKFLLKDCVNINTGEILDSSKIKMFIDMDKVNKYRESFGYYQIVSSELEMDDKQIIDTYHGLSRIEDQFRIMKGDLQTRPLYLNTPSHIKAHLLTCMISLVVLRIIQNKIVEYKNKTNKKHDNHWSMGLSGYRIQEALNKWTVEALDKNYYRFNDIDDPDLKLILDSFNIKIEKDLYTKMGLKNIKTSIKIIQ